MRFLIASLFLAITAVSCTVQKRLHQPGYHVEWKNRHHSADKIVTEEGQDMAQTVSQTPIPAFDTEAAVKPFEELQSVAELESADTTACDTIIMQSGIKRAVKLEEIGVETVRYKKCDNLDGPSFTVKKEEVHRVKYANGTEEEITPKGQKPAATTKTPPKQKVEGFGLAGFILSLGGIFIAAIPLGGLAIIFGWISIARILKHPERFRGSGFAIAAIIIGLVDILLVLLLVGTVLMI